MKRYLIIGAGAIGASLAAQFELNGIPYRLFGRGEQIRHIQPMASAMSGPKGPVASGCRPVSTAASWR